MHYQRTVLVFLLLTSLSPVNADQSGCYTGYKTKCLDPALVGVWIESSQEENYLRHKKGPPSIRGWVIRSNGDVFPLAINFDTGAFAEDLTIDYSFYGINYGCNGKLSQRTSVVGAAIRCGGKYRTTGMSLAISNGVSQSNGLYTRRTLGTEVIKPINFIIDMSLDNKPIPVPRAARRLPAYAVLRDTEAGSVGTLNVSAGDHEAYIWVPNISGKGRYVGQAAGEVSIVHQISDHISREYKTRKLVDQPMNEIVITMLDRVQGRVQGNFSYLMWRSGQPHRFKGRFDVPMYVVTPRQ